MNSTYFWLNDGMYIRTSRITQLSIFVASSWDVHPNFKNSPSPYYFCSKLECTSELQELPNSMLLLLEVGIYIPTPRVKPTLYFCRLKLGCTFQLQELNNPILLLLILGMYIPTSRLNQLYIFLA